MGEEINSFKGKKMKENNFKNKTTVQLLSYLMMIKTITGALIFIIILLLSVTIYGMATREGNGTSVALFVVGISCSATLPLQFMNMSKIKAELKLRKKN
ncbi:hypothetical protein BTO07_10895 [Polaribacter sp. SA4-12]|nr:hypothetical protein BTO07_10895 [Polaribacter sp. SA4-12]